MIALVCLSLATVIGTLLLQAGLSEQRYFDRLALQAQGEWLVEAGFSRAGAQLAKSGHYSGETWAIPGRSFGRTQSAIVKIDVRANVTDKARRRVEVTAAFADSNEPAITGSRDLESR
ncbi:MAG TPA: hypothetical protein VFG04_07695 [Planctomycetaceae bacterium]|nr:hypothetical protein [Planctomycetaceae bacterium]